ncbi:MAG: conjugal transfer protein TrbG [Candidatus Accumulibacter appositus]|uniref:Conjugal transfer protein TrbG n=1 Tax=Candidatus Accumulibacter appositus TaxID=1454003 RepID=A0A011PK01_9PROT|nr:MAG: conjugal transfer protein TrbG [Candidatus Accumulibacter appositus]
MKKPLFALLPGVASALVLAAPGDHLTELYFSDKNPTLTQQEKAAIAIAEKWKNPRAKGVAPVTGPNGSIKFLYGAQQPSIVCAVLQVCDVALQAGEQVNSINLGDTARWTVEPAVTGSGAGEVQHLIIKPLDVGLETSMVVTTNRRSYHLPQLSPEAALASQPVHAAGGLHLPRGGHGEVGSDQGARRKGSRRPDAAGNPRVHGQPQLRL